MGLIRAVNVKKRFGERGELTGMRGIKERMRVGVTKMYCTMYDIIKEQIQYTLFYF